MSILLVALGFVLLVVGGEFLVRSSVALSFRLSISKMVIGLTVVSFATSAPELLVSLNAALSGSPAIAINNVVGSNIANIGLVLGITALIGTIIVDKSFYTFNWPVMMLFSLALYYFLSNDNQLTTIEGVILFGALIVFILMLIKRSKGVDVDDDEVDPTLAKVSYFKTIMAGQGVSYNHTFTAHKQSRVLTIPVGYGDGYRRSLSNNSEVILKGKKYPVVGNICMDQFMVDIGDDSGYVGDVVTLIGKDGDLEISLESVSTACETIPYEILCGFNDRIPRIYLGESS